ncbi:MAG: hypothetical protein EBS01_07230, partial [Verrucomicrobia bacterium]|nr:hypothetical protein [Verrucomicrobiota bacterium]
MRQLHHLCIFASGKLKKGHFGRGSCFRQTVIFVLRCPILFFMNYPQKNDGLLKAGEEKTCKVFSRDSLGRDFLNGFFVPWLALIAAVLLPVLFSGGASAAPVTFAPPAMIGSSGDADVLTKGTLTYAHSIVSGSPVINGVAFSPITATSGNSNITFSGFTGSWNGCNASGTYFNALSASYQALVTNCFNNSGGAVTVTLNGLTVGRTYAVQIWVNDSRYVTSGNEFLRDENITSAGGNTVNLKYNFAHPSAGGGTGQYVIGTFVADATTQNFTMQAGSAATSISTQINGIQVRDITGVPMASFLPSTRAGAFADLDVINAGTLKYAYCYYTAAVTVNGVPFTSQTTTAGDGNFSIAGFTGVFTTLNSAGTYFNALSSNYQQLLTGGAYVDATTSTSLTLKNLTAGKTYVLQLWCNDSRSGAVASRDQYVIFGGTSALQTANNIQAAGGVGQYVTCVFTADATTAPFYICSGIGAPANPCSQICAFQVREISSANDL